MSAELKKVRVNKPGRHLGEAVEAEGQSEKELNRKHAWYVSDGILMAGAGEGQEGSAGTVAQAVH